MQVSVSNMADLKWEALNTAPSSIPSNMRKPFTITTPPKVDIWRRLTSNDFNAPAIGTRLPLSSFQSISVTVSGPWKTKFDQGGLLLAFPSSSEGSLKNSQWIKAGIEYFEGEPKIGVVGTDRYSDWSILPMFEAGSKARLEAAVEDDSIWVYAVVKGQRQPLREVKWVFDGKGNDAEIWVGVYAAKPTPYEGDEGKGLEVSFESVKVERR